MISTHTSPRKIKIIGAGFSGLTTAYFLKKSLGSRVELTVMEHAASAGGLLQSQWIDGHLLDHAANGILNHVLLEAVAQDVGLDLVPTLSHSKNRYIYRVDKGGACRFPLRLFEGVGVIFRFLFHWLTRTHRPRPNECVADYGRRVFGKDFLNYLIEPALGGIYAGDVEKMSARLVFARFFKKSRYARPHRKGLVSFKESWKTWNSALVRWLEKNGVEFQWSTTVIPTTLQEQQEAIWICATSLKNAREFLEEDERIESDSSSLISLNKLTYEVRSTADESSTPVGFGCLFPKKEQFHSLGVLWNESIFPERGEGKTETWIIGGARFENHPHSVDKNVDRLDDFIREDRRRLGWSGELKRIHSVSWPQALPHYDFELERQSEMFLHSRHPYFVGNYLGKIGLSGILERAYEVSQEIEKEINT